MEKAFRAPQKELVRTLMDLAHIEGNKTAKMIEEQTVVVAEAMRTFFDKKLLERVGFAERVDLVRVPEAETESIVIENSNETSYRDQPVSEKSDVETTEAELEVFDYVKRRLPFLMERDDALFQKLGRIFMKDRKQVLNISYMREQKGKLFSFREGKDPKYRFKFAGSEAQIDTNSLSDIDEELLGIFMRRVEELG